MTPGPTTAPRLRGLRGLVALLVALPVAGLALVVLADAIPDRAITRHIGVEILNERLTTENYGPALTGHEIDRHTDCVGITIGLGNPPGTSTVESAISSPTLGRCSDAVPRLQAYLDGDGLERSYPYYRYWHGYSAILRPLIATVGLQGTRVIMLVALVATLLGLAWSLMRSHGRAVPLVLLSPFVLTTDFIELPGSLPHATGALAILGTSWLAHEVVVRSATWPRVAAAAIVSGATVVYLDILTIPAGGWALCVAVIALAASLHTTHRVLALRVAAATGAWIAGYAWMWVWKWVLASMVFGVDTVVDVIRFTTENRLTGDNGSIDDTALASIRLNASVWWSQPLAGAVVIVLVLVIATTWRRRGRWLPPSERGLDRLIIAAPALLPLAWFELLRNHSQVHVWFTYRSIPLALGIAAAALVVVLRSDRSAMLEMQDPEDEARERELHAHRE